MSREIERLRSSIQTVCRSALPLGKIMDYIQEDMDAMQNELHTWRRENKEHGQALLHEQRFGGLHTHTHILHKHTLKQGTPTLFLERYHPVGFCSNPNLDT